MRGHFTDSEWSDSPETSDNESDDSEANGGALNFMQWLSRHAEGLCDGVPSPEEENAEGRQRENAGARATRRVSYTFVSIFVDISALMIIPSSAPCSISLGSSQARLSQYEQPDQHVSRGGDGLVSQSFQDFRTWQGGSHRHRRAICASG